MIVHSRGWFRSSGVRCLRWNLKVQPRRELQSFRSSHPLHPSLLCAALPPLVRLAPSIRWLDLKAHSKRNPLVPPPLFTPFPSISPVSTWRYATSLTIASPRRYSVSDNSNFTNRISSRKVYLSPDPRYRPTVTTRAWQALHRFGNDSTRNWRADRAVNRR